MNQDPYFKEIEKFRADAETRLRSEDGWLSVVGLSWLKPGVNTVGSLADNTVILPASTPEKLGHLILDQKGEASFILTENTDVMIDDKKVTPQAANILANDESGKPNLVKIGSVTFFVIKRKNGVGVRVKDSNSDARKKFTGRIWYETNKQYNIVAEWVAHPEPRTIKIPDILGNLNDETSPGYARFQVDGKNIELHPTQEGEKLFFVFRDFTSGNETYGAARFLTAELAADGKVTLDFNRAVNPPCAFTRFATCPMPPPENVISAAIRAGELKPVHEIH